jgi:putative NIF3 family GTP cyclohydrolase 1 type 2
LMDTQQIMRTSLRLAGFRTVPADSEIHVKGRKVRKALVAIDVGVAELLLARDLGCDAVIAHHPAGGRARLEGYKVFLRHIEQLREAGVPEEVARDAVRPKLRVLELQHHPDNYDQTPSAAKKLRMPLVSIHSPCDAIGRKMIQHALKGLGADSKVKDVVSKIGRFPEYRKAISKIEVRLGSSKNKAGKIMISHAAYTNGGYEIAKTYFQNGVGTLSYIHIAESDLSKLANEASGNLIVLGHIASDWLGINALLSELEKKGVETITTTDLN